MSQRRTAFVMGPSGCGKSSLIRAGVIPRLRAHGLRGMGSVWLVATCTPRDDPMAELVAALCSFLSPADRDAASVRSFLEGATSLAEFRTSYLEHLDPEAGLPSHYQRSNFTADEVAARREAANLFLLVDQFEEVFATEAALAPGVVQFASLLSNTMDEAERCKLKVFVLITMRSENLRQLSAIPGLTKILNCSIYHITAPDPDELEEIIVSPAQRCLSRQFGIDDLAWPAPFAPELVQLLRTQTEAIQDDPDHLPLLQHLLRMLWRSAERRLHAQRANFSIDLADLGAVLQMSPDAIRGVVEQHKPGWILRHALNGYADQQYAKVPRADRSLTDVFLTLLADRDDHGILTRRRTSRKEVLDVAGRSRDRQARDAFDRIVALLKEPHTLIRGQADASLDVAHEAFLRNWLHDDRRPDTPAAAGEERSWPWLAAERTVVRALEGVVDRYREWKQRHSDPQLLLSDMELQRWRDWGGSERNLAWYRRYAPILAGIEPLPEVPSEEDLRRRISQLQLFWNHSRAAVDHAMDERFRQRVRNYKFRVAAVVLTLLLITAVASTLAGYFYYNNARRLSDIQGTAAEISSTAFDVRDQSSIPRLANDDEIRLIEAENLLKSVKELRNRLDALNSKRDHAWLWFLYPGDHELQEADKVLLNAERTTVAAARATLTARIDWDHPLDVAAPPDSTETPKLCGATGTSASIGQPKVLGIARVTFLGKEYLIYAVEQTQPARTVWLGAFDGDMRCLSLEPAFALPPGTGVSITFDRQLRTAVLEYPADSADGTEVYHDFYRLTWLLACESETAEACSKRKLLVVADKVVRNPIVSSRGKYAKRMPTLPQGARPIWLDRDQLVRDSISSFVKLDCRDRPHSRPVVEVCRLPEAAVRATGPSPLPDAQAALHPSDGLAADGSPSNVESPSPVLIERVKWYPGLWTYNLYVRRALLDEDSLSYDLISVTNFIASRADYVAFGKERPMDIYLQLESDSGYLHIMSDSDSLISEIDKHMSAAKCTAARYVPSYKDFLRRRQDYLAGVVKRACEERPPEPSGEAVRTDASPDEN